MSASNQNNGKKGSSISVSSTPVSTPVTNTSNGNTPAATQSTPPPNNAPKYGTLVPNRIFVGGIASNTTEGELLQLFSAYGTVKAAKIIQDRAGCSKGYGFITFESEDDAKRPLRDSESITLRERKLNIAPAIKKQPFNRGFDGSSPPTGAPGNTQYYFTPPVPLYQGGVAYYNQPPPMGPGDPAAQQATVYQAPPVYQPQTGPPQATTYPSMMFPTQPLYMPPPYHMPVPYDYGYYPNSGAAGPPQYVIGNQGGTQGAPQLQQPPNASSPPRAQPCYGGQQLAPYGPPDSTMYYAPMYGPMDTASAIYTDCVDLTNGATFTEDSPYMEFKIEQHPGPNPYMLENGPPLLPQPEPCYSPPKPEFHQNAAEPTADTAIALPQQVQPTQPPREQVSNVDTACQSVVPVVSLLNFNQQPEKDYSSMQSGRRRKSTPTLPNVNTFTNGLNTIYPNMNMYTNPPPPLSYHPANFQNSFYNGMQPPVSGVAPPANPPPEGYNNYDGYNNNYHSKPMVNGYDHSRRRRPFNGDRRNGENSNRSSMHGENPNRSNMHAENPNRSNMHGENPNRSSMRADSNSSPIEENKNEERKPLPQQRNQNTSNYYSSNNTNHANNLSSHARNNNNNNTRGGYRNSAGRTIHNTNYDRRTYNRTSTGSNEQNNTWSLNVPPANPAVRNESVENSNNNRVSNDVTSSPQVHAAAAGNQNFGPPGRRNRSKPVRKNTGGSASLNEIGAGDAPLPNQDVGEACKRMESLKL